MKIIVFVSLLLLFVGCGKGGGIFGAKNPPSINASAMTTTDGVFYLPYAGAGGAAQVYYNGQFFQVSYASSNPAINSYMQALSYGQVPGILRDNMNRYYYNVHISGNFGVGQCPLNPGSNQCPIVSVNSIQAY